MTQAITCPQCRTLFLVDEVDRRASIVCPKCDGILRVMEGPPDPRLMSSVTEPI